MTLDLLKKLNSVLTVSKGVDHKRDDLIEYLMIFKPHLMSRQGIVCLLKVAYVDLRDLKLNVRRTRRDDELEVFHRNAVILAEHLVNNRKRVRQCVLIGNGAVYYALVKLEAYNAPEACRKLIILYLVTAVGGYKVLVSVLIERIEVLFATLVRSRNHPVIPRDKNMVVVLTVPVVHLLDILLESLCSAAVLVLLF